MTALNWQQEREDSDNYVCKLNALRLDICVRYLKSKGWRYAVFYQLSSSLYIDWQDGFDSLEVAQEKALVHTHTKIERDSYSLLALLKGGNVILTGVPYQHKVSKEIFVPDDITTNGVFIHAFGNGMVRFEVDKAAFLQNFERVHEAPPPKGFDEEL